MKLVSKRIKAFRLYKLASLSLSLVLFCYLYITLNIVPRESPIQSMAEIEGKYRKVPGKSLMMSKLEDDSQEFVGPQEDDPDVYYPENFAKEQEKARKLMEAEEAQKQKEAEEAQKQKEAEEARKQMEAEEARKQKEAEEARKQKEAEEARKQMEAEEARKQKEAEEARKQKEAEEARKQKEAEEAQQAEFEQVMIPKLQERCKKYPSWTQSQVERCLSFAEDGIEYDPLIFDFEDPDVNGNDPFIINLDSEGRSSFSLTSNKRNILALALISALTWKNRREIHNRIIKKLLSKKKGYHLG